ncbi:hypothetical protein F7D08_1632 [Bifidobacterium cebidarum]|uniref:Uncharacterized protein n=1 Tax=Bifidobacterium cebidarum TaxID=2650773 RepID=A0A6I1G7W5_9BIFI|nr:hypothetical protein F7D08_1632 [Bifidobacterium cebidarum]
MADPFMRIECIPILFPRVEASIHPLYCPCVYTARNRFDVGVCARRGASLLLLRGIEKHFK